MKMLGRTNMLLESDAYLDIIIVDYDDQYVVWYQNIQDMAREGNEWAGRYQGSYFRKSEDNAKLKAYYEYHRRVADMINRSGGNI